MNAFVQFLRSITGLFRWWVVVMPWESAVRVWMGKHPTVIGPGVHLRVPIAHAVYKQSVRLRVMNLTVQTVTTRDGKTVTLSAAVGFVISDILMLYQSVHDFGNSLGNLVLSAIAEYVQSHDALECTPQRIAPAVASALDGSRFGLSDMQVFITDFAFVRTYRFITDQRWGVFSGSQDVQTTYADGEPKPE